MEAALDGWLEAYRAAMTPPFGRMAVPGLDPTPQDAAVRRSVAAAAGLERLYAWARLRRTEDGLARDFRLSITGPRLGDHIVASTPPSEVSGAQLDALARYFGNACVEKPLYSEMWGLFAPPRSATDIDASSRDETLRFFIRLVSRRRRFQSYQDLRKILERIQPSDAASLGALTNLELARPHLAGLFAVEAIRTVGLDRDAAAPGRRISEVLGWFASAARETPSDGWRKKRARLEQSGEGEALRALANWARRERDRTPSEDDALFARVLRSATWLSAGDV